MRKWNLNLTVWKLVLILVLFVGLIIPLKTFGQVYSSRDNHTNLWQNRSAWTQNWAGIAAPTNITDAEAHVYGYVTHGLAGTPDSLAFTGTTGKLVVQDTLRIHGNLNMYNGASLHIKPGGILIVHGNYEQEANVNFINEGQAIFVGDWTALGSSGSFSNTGNLYVNGTIDEGGINTLYQPFSALANDNYLLYYFTYVRVISAVCSGNNHDTLTFSGSYKGIVRWESSLSFFRDDTTFISNQTEIQLYTNLLQTTSYRVYYETNPPMSRYEYSTGATIVVLESSQGGTLSGPTEVCTGANTAVLSLNNSIGEVIRWESSTDNFAEQLTIIDHKGESLNLTDIPETTSYRAIVKNGDCSEVASAVHTVEVKEAVALTESPSSGYLTSFPFNGNANDVSGNGNHGIVEGAALTTDRFGAANNAYFFDGLDDYIATTNLYPAPGPNIFSVSIWFNTTTATGGRLLGYGASQTGESSVFDRHLYMTNSGKLYFGVYPEEYKTVATGSSYNDGKWHHAVATLSQEGMKLYVDGVLQVSDPSITVAENYSGYLRIGYDNLIGWPQAPDSYFFQGKIDDIFVFDRELSHTEIYKLHGAGANPVCEGETLQLTAATVAGASYAWVGPNGFTSAEQNPSITNVTTEKAGVYTVTATVNGCSSEISTEINISPASKGGDLAGSTEVCAGANSGTLSLSGYTGNILRWESSTDNFKTITSIASTGEALAYENLSETISYRVVVKSGVCGEAYSTAATITVSSLNAGLLEGAQTVCAGANSGEITLRDWQGEILRWESSSDGFTTKESIAHTAAVYTFENLTETTRFRAVIGNAVCQEIYSPEVEIKTENPAIGGFVTANVTEVCEGENEGVLSLQEYTGEIVRWEYSFDGFTTKGQVIDSTRAELLFANLLQNTSFRAVVKNSVCGEEYSASAIVQVDQLPVPGEISGGDIHVCADANSGSLNLINYSGNILRWESSNDNFIEDIQPIAYTDNKYAYENLAETTSYRAVVGNGSCKELVSAANTIFVDKPAVGGSLSGSTEVCEGTNGGTLSLSAYTGTIIRWESSVDNFVSSTAISSTAEKITYQNLSQTTAYRAVIRNGVCQEVYSQPATVQVKEASVGGTLAGGMRIKQGENEGALELHNFKGEIVQWELSTDNFEQDVQVLAHSSSSLTFKNIEVETWYRVMVQNNECTPAYSEAARLWINQAPIALADTFRIQVGTAFSSSSSLLENDYDSDGDVLLITPGLKLTTVAGNGLSIDEKGYISYQPQLGFIGADSLQYSVCDVAGEVSECTYSWVVLYVEKEKPEGAPVLVYQGVSPNGDGLNDSWVIDYIALYPSNLVQLFDRYGVLVYEVAGYNNQDKVFDGFSNRGNLGGDGSLPEATYYYRIRLNADLPVLKGYVILNR
jgi:gliding motility-associated-like protein